MNSDLKIVEQEKKSPLRRLFTNMLKVVCTIDIECSRIGFVNFINSGH
jgi:hypothetical protein